MRQEVTRAHKGWALDSVTLHNEVLKVFKEELASPPSVSQILTPSIRPTLGNFFLNENVSTFQLWFFGSWAVWIVSPDRSVMQ